MPIYEYQCDACGHYMDALQKVSEAPLTDCPECNKPSLQRLVSAPRFRLKGSGWYETDFKKENQRNLADSAKKDDGKGADKSETKKPDQADAGKSKSDAKPADSGKSSSSSNGDKAA